MHHMPVRFAVAAGLCLAIPASAGTLYKCKDPSGSVRVFDAREKAPSDCRDLTAQVETSRTSETKAPVTPAGAAASSKTSAAPAGAPSTSDSASAAAQAAREGGPGWERLVRLRCQQEQGAARQKLVVLQTEEGAQAEGNRGGDDIHSRQAQAIGELEAAGLRCNEAMNQARGAGVSIQNLRAWSQ